MLFIIRDLQEGNERENSDREEERKRERERGKDYLQVTR